MDEQMRTVFLGEVERQCTFALMAAEDKDRSLSRGEVDRIWYSIQMLLVAVGNISKMLWPSEQDIRKGKKGNGKGKRTEAAAEELRGLLGVAKNSLLKCRNFRNHFEHFDSRLEEWVSQHPGANFLDSNIGPFHGTQTDGVDLGSPHEVQRYLSPDGTTLVFQGETYSLTRVVEAVRELQIKATKLSCQDDWHGSREA